MFHLIFGVPWLIVAARFILPLPWSWALKIALAVLLLLVSQYHWFSRLSSGSVFSPEFPRPLILAFNLLLGAMLMLAVFQLVLDAVSLVLLAIKGSFPVVPAGVRYAIGGLALALSAFGVSQAILVPQTKDIQVTIPGLPAAFDGYQLVQLTDLHISRLFPARWAQQLVERTNALDADLIVVTGDLIDGNIESRSADVAPLSGLRARDGVLAIPGNHEYFFGYEAWMRYFQGLNMQILANGHAVIARGGESLVIAGVTDHSAARTGMPAPDVRAALAGAPEGAPVILLDHQPRNAVDASTTRVALQLSGHTHGGMVLGLDRLVANANNGFVSGFYRVGAMQLYVNNGTALWPGFALRLGRPSELTRITLRSSR
ncbi:metallophosphoesterase [Pseudorhizobium pelagicum]|uniref:Metallophosphoesterase n=1 Tax=Pseudorhizobium pelagicum TaxID=1509405 RepID=A0A922P3K0_9HYPH|nr:metallophosphoesterase [Pseudorhizobium pelagicum]KEQ05279.1 metallophosphoesterase [Pseudorhizobium pelagicum]KEQ07876.1 metallophosphoesterase [Pseudorhizobium pelagicum]